MLGGESSGHVICAEVSRAGDGLVAALKVIEIMLATEQPLSELRRVLCKYPQSVLALKVREKLPLEQLVSVQDAIRTVESEMAERGRILVRYSGTEPKIRLLVEHEELNEGEVMPARLEAAVRRDLVVG